MFVLSLSLFACEEEAYFPKPIGYSRLDFPAHSYLKYSEDCPFEFEYGKSSNFVAVEGKNGATCWFNIEYPNQKAKVHFSYLDITNKPVEGFIEDTRKLAMEHLTKADDFEENVVIDDSARIYGVIYDFKGSTASNMQFFLTDSTHHFVRGALYFEVTPKADSLAPAEKFIEEELTHLINTFTWK